MKALLSIGLMALLLPGALAQNPAAPNAGPTIPEIETVRGPYLKNLAAIRAASDARTAGILRSYVASLQRLQGDSTITSNLKAALAVKAETERAAKNQEPSEDDRKAMPAQLLALRRGYDRDREPIVAEARRQEDQQTRAYVASLEIVQRQLTTQNQLEKALAVRNLIDSLNVDPRVENWIGRWHRGFKNGLDDDITILRDRTCTREDSEITGKWTLTEAFFTIRWSNGVTNRLPATATGDRRSAEEQLPSEGTGWTKGRLTYIRK